MTSDFDHLLGTLPDRVVAERVGVSRVQVFKRRQSLGIRAWAAWIEWEQYDHLLGTLPDAEVARGIGCTGHAVSRRRRLLEIPSHRSTADSRWVRP